MPETEPALNFWGMKSIIKSIYRFDILIDKKFKPFLLEVNHAPSFNDDTEIDKEVKTNLITDTLRLLNINHENKQRIIANEKRALLENNNQ